MNKARQAPSKASAAFRSMYLAAAVLFFSFYMLLAGSVSWSEAGTGAVLAVCAAALSGVWTRQHKRNFAYRGHWVRIIGAPLASLVPDTLRVAKVLAGALWRPSEGRLGALCIQPFMHGPDDGPSAFRRGAVTLGLSLAPNGYVLDVPSGSDTIVLHQLQPVPSSPERIWPL